MQLRIRKGRGRRGAPRHGEAGRARPRQLWGRSARQSCLGRFCPDGIIRPRRKRSNQKIGVQNIGKVIRLSGTCSSHGSRFHQASCALIQKAPRDLASEVRIALSKPFRFAYIQPAASCGYGDKRRRNKLFGPGGGTRRLHLSPALIMRCADLGGGEIGSTGSVKGALLLGMVPPSSGRFYSCQRQLCSGGPRRVMR